MSKIIIFTFSLLLLLSHDTISQPTLTYPLKSSDICARVTFNENNGQKWIDILQLNELTWYFGQYNDYRYRGFFQWNLPDNIIPDGSTVISATLYIQVTPVGHSIELLARLYDMKYDLNQATAEQLWERSDIFSGQTEYLIGTETSTNYVIQKTFFSGSDFTNAIETSLSDDFFTLGVLSGHELLWEYPYRTVGNNIKLEVTFTPPVQQVLVDQKRSDGFTSFGSVGRWEGGLDFEQYQVPNLFDFYLNFDEALQAYQGFAFNPVEKYHDWENYDDVTNHHVFEITTDLNELTSKFEKTYEMVTIENNFISAPGSDPEDDIIEFKDPWFIDYLDPVYGNNLRNQGMSATFHPRQSPFQPDYNTLYNGNKYLGAFMNQSGPPLWNPPFYSVRAQQNPTITFHGQPIEWYFLGWELDPAKVAYEHPNQTETAVVFKSGDAIASARYKGHMASNTHLATASNNGRKVARDGEDILHAVYVDNGEIFYTYSDDEGETWSPEELVSYGEFHPDLVNESPCIAEKDGKILVSWSSIWYDQGQFLGWGVLYKEKDLSTNQWSIFVELDWGENPVIIPKPSIATGTWYHEEVMVVYGKSDPMEIKSCYKNFDDLNFQFYSEPFEGTDPSVSGVYGYLVMVYELDDMIYARRWSDKAELWREPVLISDELWWADFHCKPNISQFNQISHITWRANEHLVDDPLILYRTMDFWSLELSETTILPHGYQACDNPSVSSRNLEQASVYYTIAFDVYKASYDGIWTGANFGQGLKPGAAEHGVRGAIWTTETSAPYFIMSDIEEISPEKIMESSGQIFAIESIKIDTLDSWQRLDYHFKSGDLTLEVRNTELNQNKISFNPNLQSGLLNITSGASTFDFQLFCRFHNMTSNPAVQTELLQLQFKTGKSIHSLLTLKLSDLIHLNNNSNHILNKSINLSSISGKIGVFKLKFLEKQPIYTKILVGHNSTLTKETIKPSEVTVVMPKEFQLYQNFPNPYNPETTISFDLPKEGTAKLQIFNSLGEHVATLVSQRLPAGTHQYKWNSGSLASGVYLYRLEAEGFVETRKMILMK